LLNRPDIGSALEQSRGEAMAERVRANHLGLPCPSRRDFDGFVYDSRVHMMAADNSG